MNRRVLISVVVVALVVASVGYYEYSSYEQTVLQTSVVTGKISNIQGTPIPLPTPGKSATGGASLVTVSIGSISFVQIMPCSPVKGAFVGETVQVADQLLRSGQHQYAPDIACSGSASPFRSVYPHGAPSSSTTVT
jgi:hypothetical protein